MNKMYKDDTELSNKEFYEKVKNIYATCEVDMPFVQYYNIRKIQREQDIYFKKRLKELKGQYVVCKNDINIDIDCPLCHISKIKEEYSVLYGDSAGTCCSIVKYKCPNCKIEFDMISHNGKTYLFKKDVLI